MTCTPPCKKAGTILEIFLPPRLALSSLNPAGSEQQEVQTSISLEGTGLEIGGLLSSHPCPAVEGDVEKKVGFGGEGAKHT